VTGYSSAAGCEESAEGRVPIDSPEALEAAIVEPVSCVEALRMLENALPSLLATKMLMPSLELSCFVKDLR